MALTPETLPRHELNGLPVRVVDADDPGMVDLTGRVVTETTNTLEVASRVDGESRVRQVPKSGTTFEFAITDDAAGDETSPGTAFKLANVQPATGEQSPDADRGERCTLANVRGRSHTSDAIEHFDGGDEHAAGENVAYVTVDGSRLVGRPARRTETTGDSPWQ